MSRKFKNSELIVRGGIGLNPKTKKSIAPPFDETVSGFQICK